MYKYKYKQHTDKMGFSIRRFRTFVAISAVVSAMVATIASASVHAAPGRSSLARDKRRRDRRKPRREGRREQRRQLHQQQKKKNIVAARHDRVRDLQSSDALSLEIYGANVEITAADESEYLAGQNHGGKVSPDFPTQNSIHLKGNLWSAYELPEQIEVTAETVLRFTFELRSDTVKGFQAICLDEHGELGASGMCFTIRTTQGTSGMEDWIMLPPAVVGGTTDYEVPVGKYLVGPVNYLAFLQDSDGRDRSKGESTFSDVRLVSVPSKQPDTLSIDVYGTFVELGAGDESEYDQGQNGGGSLPDFPTTNSIHLAGNRWSAYLLPQEIEIYANTVLRFKFHLQANTEKGFQAICLDEDRELSGPNGMCFVLATTQGTSGIEDWIMAPIPTALGETVEHNFPVGKFYTGATAKYLIFLQDSDGRDRSKGEGTYSDLQFLNAGTNLIITMEGETVAVPNAQIPAQLQMNNDFWQDSLDHLLSVSSDGNTVTGTGNTWKAFALAEPIVVTAGTVLDFTFHLDEIAEFHSVCLEDDIAVNDGKMQCYVTAGTQTSGYGDNIAKMKSQTKEGETRDYSILIGSDWQGTATHLMFLVDNDAADRTTGQSSWSNINIYRLPDLDITLDGATLTIPNKQMSYDSNQDTTPIREHMAEFSTDRTSITLRDNMWRALPIDPPLSEMGDFILSFDFSLVEYGEFHAICLDENRVLTVSVEPDMNGSDPRRCLITAYTQGDLGDNKLAVFVQPQTHEGETNRYHVNLSKYFERVGDINYLALLQDNDLNGKVGGESTFGNIEIRTGLSTCHDWESDFNLRFDDGDCTSGAFLDRIGDMLPVNCPHGPILEMMAYFDVAEGREAERKIESICSSAFEAKELEFDQVARTGQAVGEFLDGGTPWNYEHDMAADGAALAKDAGRIAVVNSRLVYSQPVSWPDHHALDNCDRNMAMCCWVAARADCSNTDVSCDADPVDNTDVCYVNMKESKHTAHVRDGYSIYGANVGGNMNCHGFAWGNEGGYLDAGLKGNTLFKVGFYDHLYNGARANVEQVPGAPLCGCLDRMPVVTRADCTRVTAPSASVEVSYLASIGQFDAWLELGTVAFEDCGDLRTHADNLTRDGKMKSADLDFVNGRIVGEGNCPAAISSFLGRKGFVYL